MFEDTEQSDSRIEQQSELSPEQHAGEAVIVEDQDSMEALADERFFEAEQRGPTGKVSTRFEFPDQG